MDRNSRIFEDKEMEVRNIFQKAEITAALWSSTDKAFKDFPFSFHNWKDVTGH